MATAHAMTTSGRASSGHQPGDLAAPGLRVRGSSAMVPARHLLRSAAIAAPLIVVVAGVWRGSEGAVSSVIGLALAVANLFVSAWAIDWAATISFSAIAMVALGGYIVRLAVITTFVLLIKDASWADLPALSISLVVGYLALLIFEARVIARAADRFAAGRE